MWKLINKIDLAILIVIACALSLAVVLLYGFNNGTFDFLKNDNQKQASTTVTPQEPKIIRTDYSEVARKTLDWIDKQRNQDGWYILEKGCDYQNKTCDIVWDNQEGNKDGLIATWARLNFYHQHQDPKDLEIVKKDIDIFYEKYKDDNLNDSLWICKITYEMAQSKYIEQDQKDKLQKLCFEIKPPEVISDLESYKIRLGKTNSEALQKDEILWNSWQGYTLIRGVDNYFGLISDLVYQYVWKKDETRLSEAKKYFQSAKVIIDQMGVSAKAEDECLSVLSALELYQAGNKDEQFLNYAYKKYDSFFGKDGDMKKYQTTICGLMSKKLYQLTAERKFFDRMEANNRMLIEVMLDENNSLASTINDNGFYRTNFGGGAFPIKNVVENGLIIELIKN